VQRCKAHGRSRSLGIGSHDFHGTPLVAEDGEISHHLNSEIKRRSKNKDTDDLLHIQSVVVHEFCLL